MNSKLTPKQWDVVRIAFLNGENVSKIAKNFKISRNSIYKYANKRNWIIKKDSKFTRFVKKFLKRI